jgi:hypothetical protein
MPSVACPSELVHLVEHLESTPLSCKQIKLWTDHDTTLSRIRTWVLVLMTTRASSRASGEIMN